jgi:PTS system nitrogen regulatory IIA component
MMIHETLVRERCFYGVPGNSKKRVLEQASELISAQSPDLDSEQIFAGLIGRERLGSTGLGQGIAVPHARLDNLKEAHACLVKLNEGVNYDAVDKQSVDLIFALFIPEESTEEHLQILAALARIFSQKPVTDKIRNSSSAEEIISHIQQAELAQLL